jgi:hypothetical protein
LVGALRLVADAYGLDREGRAELLTATDDAIARIEAVRRSVDAGDPNAVEIWNRTVVASATTDGAPGGPTSRTSCRRPPLRRILALHARRGLESVGLAC